MPARLSWPSNDDQVERKRERRRLELTIARSECAAFEEAGCVPPSVSRSGTRPLDLASGIVGELLNFLDGNDWRSLPTSALRFTRVS